MIRPFTETWDSEEGVSEEGDRVKKETGVRGQGSEVRGQRTEDRGQKSEVRGQRSEDREEAMSSER